MIIILEGVNGTGKTAYCKLLEKKLGWPYYRAFRKGADKHDPEHLEQLREIGIAANTHVDDIYIADFLQTFKINGICERSLPSELAYGEVYDGEDKALVAKAFKYWKRQLEKVPHVYVWLEADYEVVKNRQSGFRPTKKDHDKLVNVYDKVFRKMGKSKMRIDTGTLSIEAGATAICHHLKKY